MAHYAFLNSQKKVTEVITGRDENEVVNGITDWETYYGNIRGQTCKRTSFNTHSGVHLDGGTPFRKNFAGIGYKYYSSIDGFVPPKPYPSWTLNNTTGLWDAPTPMPTDGNNYEWNEDSLSWVRPNSPYPSWNWNEEECKWQPPVAYPSDYETTPYRWNEDDQTWDLIE